MKTAFAVLWTSITVLSLSACISSPVPLTTETAERLRQQPPVRFLLSFDDGPSATTFYNPTATVLDSLADNPLEPNIKAVFSCRPAQPGRATVMRKGADAA